eukprot:TRINITY_DN14392_c0_g1_i1.p2 TRINITY_DN14392_c0_g1~~TRINITY_DN14392_c0_g1_i1.p2  ORF type:complete len:534 (+),score=185.62 TRINITY_DN14392_c0_g1_i1:87-1604(+)
MGRVSMSNLGQRLSTVKQSLKQRPAGGDASPGAARRSAGGAGAERSPAAPPCYVILRHVRDEDAAAEARALIPPELAAQVRGFALQRDRRGRFRQSVRVDCEEGAAEALARALDGRPAGGAPIRAKRVGPPQPPGAVKRRRVVLVDSEEPPAKRARGAATAPDGPAPAAAAAAPQTYFVGNLPKSPDAEARLRKALRKACGAKLARFQPFRDERGLPKGCALVAFCRERQAKPAMAAAESGAVVLDGQPVRIQPRQTRDQLADAEIASQRATCMVCNIPLSLAEWQLREVMEAFGKVNEVTLHTSAEGGFNGTAKVVYADGDCAAAAVAKSGKVVVNKRPLRIDLDKRKLARLAQQAMSKEEQRSNAVIVRPARPGRTLCADAVRACFARCGEVAACIPRRNGGVKVRFAATASVPIALQLVGRKLACTDEKGDTPVVVSVAKPPPETAPAAAAEGGEGAAQEPEQDLVFDYSGGRSKKDDRRQKRLDHLQRWNRGETTRGGAHW